MSDFVLEQGMQEYLTGIAIKTKIENYKEFGKDKAEILAALVKKFKISEKEAEGYIERFYSSDPYSISNGAEKSLAEKRQLLLEEKEKKIQEYDLAISIIEDAINGYSAEVIAKQKGILLEKVLEILK